MNDQPIKKQTFLQGTAVLAMATVLVKLMGFLFKVPLNNIIGEDGFGYFNTAYDVYNVLLMISTTGLPVAMSRMISQAQTLGNHAQIKRIYRTSLYVFLTMTDSWRQKNSMPRLPTMPMVRKTCKDVR